MVKSVQRAEEFKTMMSEKHLEGKKKYCRKISTISIFSNFRNFFEFYFLFRRKWNGLVCWTPVKLVKRFLFGRIITRWVMMTSSDHLLEKKIKNPSLEREGNVSWEFAFLVMMTSSRVLLLTCLTAGSGVGSRKGYIQTPSGKRLMEYKREASKYIFFSSLCCNRKLFSEKSKKFQIKKCSRKKERAI